METKNLSRERFDRIKKHPIYFGDESLLFINPDNRSQLLKLFREDVAAKPKTLENIMIASEKQSTIQHTTLPLGAFFVDDQFKGSILQHHKRANPIDRLTALPLKSQIIVLKNMLRNIKELSDNYIYQTGLKDPYSYGVHQPSIVFTRNLDVQIIDLDGSSTEYSDCKIDSLDQFMLGSTNNVVLNLLRDILYNCRQVDLYAYKKEEKEDELSLALTALKKNELDYFQLENIIEPVLKMK